MTHDRREISKQPHGRGLPDDAQAPSVTPRPVSRPPSTAEGPTAPAVPAASRATTGELEPDLGSRLFAAEGILSRLDDLRAHLPHLHDTDDIEHVHQTRVACRRLRTLLDLFGPCFRRKRVRAWRRSIKRLGSALGDARDLDVQIEFLEGLAGGLHAPSMNRGVDRLLLRLRQERRRVQKSLPGAVKRFRKSGTMKELDHVVREAIARGRIEGVSNRHPWLWQQAEERITTLLESLLYHEPCVERPSQVEEHHRMRIAAKRLRYAMEAFAPLYEGELSDPLDVVRRLQSLLGDLHDCDVWIEFLPRFVRDERRRSRRFHGHSKGFGRVRRAIEEVERDRITARDRFFRAFGELWQTRAHPEVWTDLRRTLVAFRPV